MSYSEEEWKPAVGFEAWYFISDRGRVFSVSRRKPITPFLHDDRYHKVALRLDGRVRKKFVHRLVAEAFLGTRPDGYTVNHRDGNKLNNRVDNLEYLTQAENNRHAIRTGLRAKPDRLYGCCAALRKLSEEQVRDIRRRFGTDSYRKIGREFNVRHSTIRDIAVGRTWKNVM